MEDLKVLKNAESLINNILGFAGILAGFANFLFLTIWGWLIIIVLIIIIRLIARKIFR